MASVIPLRPRNKKYSLTKEQQDCLTYYVITGCTRQEAFLLFFPEFLKYEVDKVVKGKLTKAGEQYCRQFFATAEVNDYIRDYKKTIGEKKAPNNACGPEIDDSRKDNALKSLFDHVMNLVESSTELDADTLKVATEIFKKLGWLKDEEEQQEAPRRYLPEKCSDCLYKSFVESHIESGEIENACLRCKALKIAEEQGFRYDPKDLLLSERRLSSTI